jgi:hypothetical protein
MTELFIDNFAGGKIILDLCGGTGTWSKPYKDAGYDVRVITLPEHDVRTYMPPKNVYGILAAPPCTEFSIAKGAQPRDFHGAMEIVKSCLQIIWRCRAEGSVKFWALENPVGFLRQFLGVPAYQFEQWQFGEQRMKRTDIWGYFNTPTPTVKQKPVKAFRGHCICGYNYGVLECPPEYVHLGLDQAAIRAITPPGFARAFFKANR